MDNKQRMEVRINMGLFGDFINQIAGILGENISEI